jgi:C-terminal processing protease CtpA/Prc/Tol biopolymer transport system component
MKHIVITAIWIILMLTGLFAKEPSFAGDPAISPDGTKVCFVYDGDLWVVPFNGGIPRRITNTPSNEWNPQWSPNGDYIAFASNREGDSYLYLISSEGGESKAIIRENLNISDWFKDSNYLLCNKYSFRWGRSFYKVPIDGSRPELIAEVGARYASLSPDNSKIVYQQGGYAYRESYQGSANGELWQLDISSKKYTKLTNTKTSELYPRFSHNNNNLYFCASYGDQLQLAVVSNLKFSKQTKISNLDKFSARDISIARANDRIVFECFDQLYTYDPLAKSGDKIHRLVIDLAIDDWQDNLVRSKVTNEFNNYAVSPDELLVGFNYKYDTFFMPRKGGEVKQVTFDHSGFSGMQFVNNRELVFTKLDKGKNKLYIAKADSLINIKPVEWFAGDSLNVEDFYRDDEGRWTILYDDYFRHNKIAIADSGFVNIRPIDTPWSVTTNFAINKKGTYAVYGAIRDDSYIRELYLHNLRTGENRRLLTDDAWLGSLVWTPDNRSILLTRNRSIYRLDLVPRDELEYDKDNWKEILSPEKPAVDSIKTETDKDGNMILDIVSEDTQPDDSTTVEILWQGLNNRYYPVISSVFESLFVLKTTSDSTFLYIEDANYSDKSSSLKKANIYGQNIKEEFSFGKDAGAFSLINNNIYYLDSNKLKSYNIGTSAKKEVGNEFDYQIDKAVLNTRVFEQAWGAFGENFYDPDMHGKNWKEVYDLYRPYVDKARSIQDIAEIVNEMIGDVNASHTGFYPRQDTPRNSQPSAYIGAEFDYEQVLPQGIRLSKVYPESRLGSFYKLTDGAVITAVNGTEINTKVPMDSLLAGKIGKRITLAYLQDGKAGEATIVGLDFYQMRELNYGYSVEQSRKLVEKLSNGRLGYIHIPAMGNNDWNKFYSELFRDNFDKEALVIDVRGNTGGHIHDQIISLLEKKRYAYSSSRNLSRTLRTEPRRAWDKPSIVLVNEQSFSDGEIFPTVYQELKLGKVVGTPSSGAVIGTWEYSLMDGSSMRMPGSGWYKLDGTNMEGTGAMPDIIVEQLPEDTIADRDPQLERAVKELLKELKQ